MKQQKIYAVITGDVVGFSKLGSRQRQALLRLLKKTFSELENIENKDFVRKFEIFRGDSFQGAVENPENSLVYALIIRMALRKYFPESNDKLWDARISIGIGKVDFLTDRVAEADGEAFRNSGRALDTMKDPARLLITTPWQNVNDELEVLCVLLDVLINKWTFAQSEVVYEKLKHLTQDEIAAKLEISQAAVNLRLKAAGWTGVDKTLSRFRLLVKNQIQ
jgi:hypothetical protein